MEGTTVRQAGNYKILKKSSISRIERKSQVQYILRIELTKSGSGL